jgi:hypothetical protein
MLKKAIPMLLLSFLFFFLIQVGYGNVQAQTFYFKNYFLGNIYDPGNRSFSWKASNSCPFNWSIKINGYDTLGGEIELHASPGTKPNCKRVYKITWVFSKDIRTVSCGEKIFIDVTNIPISKGDCGIYVWEGDTNPSSITILTEGESRLVEKIISKDPGKAYRSYVFQHHPGQTVQGEPSEYQAKAKEQHLHQARLELVVCSRPDMAKNANGGSFSFRIGNRGISFDVVYLYSKMPVEPPSDKLGREWHESESGWQGVWKRRGNSNIFDARWESGHQTITAELTIIISGNRVTIERRNSSDGNDCKYSGTIANDGVTVEGTYTCTRYPGPFPWRAIIQR